MDAVDDRKARTTLAVFGVAIVVGMTLLVLFSTLFPIPGPGSASILVGCAAFVGACAGRMRWISHFAFKTKTFDASLIPHHYAWVLTGTAVVLAFLAFPAQTGLLGANLGTYALAFGLGAFSEDVWDALHGRIRAFLGKSPRDDAVLPEIIGNDVPLDALKDIVLDGGVTAADAIAKLRTQGITYGHALVAWRDSKRLSVLAERTGVPARGLEQLANVADSLRDAAHLAPGIAAAAKKEGLSLQTISR